MSRATALVFCGGGPATAPVPALEDPLVVAADSGVIEAHRRGLRVDLLVGDLDSAPPEEVKRVTSGQDAGTDRAIEYSIRKAG